MPSHELLKDQEFATECQIAGQNGTVSAFGLTSKQAIETTSLEESVSPDPLDLCVPDLFEAQVQRTPDAIAAEFERQRLTYRELNRRANQLAHYLRARGVGPDVLVGICVWRSLDTIVAVLGVLKAGGAYVPFDPLYPRERLAFMIEDAQPPVLLTQQQVLPCLPNRAGHVVCLDTDWPKISEQGDHNPVPLTRPESLVYVIYTSGSTGKPKGVQVLSRGLVNILNSMRREPGLTAEDIWLSITTLSFDIATLELLLPLVVGARVVLAGRGAGGDGALLGQLLSQSGATILQATPATWRLLVQSGWQNGSLRKALSGGEALPRTLANQLLDQGVELWNLYGPTETTIYSTGHQVVSREGPVPIGRPVANTEAYVLDADLHPVPPGESGELLLGGGGLARGYLNQSEQTNARFIPHPFDPEPGARLYKTGDLCRWLPDGTLEFLGRLDHQVKIHGHRIELGEIEATLAHYPGVREALVTACDDGLGTKRLVSYLVGDASAGLAPSALRNYLESRLPAYMVPSTFMLLDTFPLTPNGKVDRRALPEPVRERFGVDDCVIHPRSNDENKLVCIWEDLLQVHPIGITDNFFELGGDSILAAHMLMRVRECFGQDLPVSVLLHGATVEYLANLIKTPPERHSWPSLVTVQPHGNKPPLFLVHAIGGEILMYTPLARELGPDQPVYAFRAQGRDGGGEPYDRIEDMAAHYVEEMLAARPRGPFLLGGYSFGGIVAFEMAQELRRRGHAVSLLLIIDMELPLVYRQHLHSPSWLFRFACNVLRWLFHQSEPCTLKKRLAEIRQKISIVRKALEGLPYFAYKDPGPLGVISIGAMLDVPEKHRKVLRANYKAIMSYVPQPYAGRVTLIRARTQPLVCSFQRDMGWGQMAARRVEVFDVPGYHFSIFREPDVHDLGNQVRRCLAKAAAAT